MGILKYFKQKTIHKTRKHIPSKYQKKTNNANPKIGYQKDRPQITLDNAIKTKKLRRKKRFGVF